MIYKETITIEDYIFKYLKNGPQVVASLIEKIKTERASTTKQGVYAALRALKAKAVVVIYGGKVSLHSTWLTLMTEYVSIAGFHYAAVSNQQNDFLNLKEGERIQYNFKDTVAADTFWGHIQNILIETAPAGGAVLSWDPHYWPLLVHSTEKPLIERVLDKKLAFLMLVGGRTAMDRAIQKEFNGTTSQYEMLEKPLSPKKNYYVSLIGDFIIEVYINNEFAEEIDAVYSQDIVNDELKQRIKDRATQKTTTRFVLSKNKRKSDLLKKKIGKYFVWPSLR